MPTLSAYEETYTIGQLGRSTVDVRAGSTLEIYVTVPSGTVGKTFTAQFQHVSYVSPTEPPATPGIDLAGSFTVTVLDAVRVLLTTPTDTLLAGRYLYNVVSMGAGRVSVSSVKEFTVLVPITLGTPGLPVLPPSQGAAGIVSAHNSDINAHGGAIANVGVTYSVLFTEADLDLNGLLTKLHGLPTKPDNVLVYSDDGLLVSPASVYVTTSIVSVDLQDFRPLTGNWQLTADSSKPPT